MEKSENLKKIEKSLEMTFPQFVMKLFGYETMIVQIVDNKTQKTDYVERYVKMHKNIFKEVFYNAMEMFIQWFRVKFINVDYRLVINPKLVDWTIKNPMNEKMKIGYIESPEYKKKG